MTECNHEAISFSNCRKRQVRVNFSGGSISSNGGALLLREVDRRMGLTAAVARALGDRRQHGKVRHEVLTMVRQRVHAVALGHEDLNDHDALRDDPVVQTACERDESLASSSTLCRFEQRAERQWAIAIQHQLVEQFIGSFTHRPRELVLDFDATDDPVHGHLESPRFGGHVQAVRRRRHPMLKAPPPYAPEYRRQREDSSSGVAIPRGYAACVVTTSRCPSTRRAASTWPMCERWSRSNRRRTVPSTVPSCSARAVLPIPAARMAR